MNAPRNPRYHSLDFWRGIACLAVIIFHSMYYVATEALDTGIKEGTLGTASELVTWITTRFWAGVPMFFVISGYCIAASADAQRRRGHPASRFFLKRFWRIYPPLWVFIAIFTPIVCAVEIVWPGGFADDHHGFSRPWWLDGWQWIGSLTLTETWRPHIIGDHSRLLFAHMWTLCYEEQFYFVAGLLLLVSPRLFFGGTIAVTIAVGLLQLSSLSTKGFFFDGKWFEFAAGIAVYYFLNHANRYQQIGIFTILLCAFVAQFRQPDLLWEFRANPRQMYVVSFGFALLLIAIHRFDSAIAKSTIGKLVSICGVMCYTVYLLHWPIAKLLSHSLYELGIDTPFLTLLLTVPLTIAASIAISVPFHHYVERRFMARSTLRQMEP